MAEHQKIEFLAFPLKVIISPLKAFKDIAQNPDVKGLIVIVGLILLATTGAYYAYASKLTWTVDSQLTSLLASNMFANYIFSAVTQTALLFFFNWLIYAGVLLLVMRAFGEKAGSWRPFFLLVGYAFSVTIIQWAVSAVLIATLPEIPLPITAWPPTVQDEPAITSKFAEMWGPAPAFHVLIYLTSPYLNVIDIWFIMLSVIAVRAFSEAAWRKAVTISTSAALIRFAMKYFLGL